MHRPLAHALGFDVCALLVVWLQRHEGQALLAAERVYHAAPAQVARPRTGLRHRHQGEAQAKARGAGEHRPLIVNTIPVPTFFIKYICRGPV